MDGRGVAKVQTSIGLIGTVNAGEILLLFFLKSTLNSKSGHDGVQHETTDGSPLAFRSSSDLLRLFPRAIDEKSRFIAGPPSYSIWHPD